MLGDTGANFSVSSHLPPEEIDELLAEFSSILATSHTADSARQRVVELTQRAIGPCDGAGLMRLEGDLVSPGAYSADLAKKADYVQLNAGQGPCVHALREGVSVLVDDLASSERFGVEPKMVSSSGVKSSFSIPLKAGPHTIGVLNLYSLSTQAFSEEDRSIALLLSHSAAAALVNVEAYQDAKQLTDQLQQALESRAVIDQAKGILVATEGITPEAAFDRLRKTSQMANIPVREIAAELVKRYVRKHS